MSLLGLTAAYQTLFSDFAKYCASTQRSWTMCIGVAYGGGGCTRGWKNS